MKLSEMNIDPVPAAGEDMALPPLPAIQPEGLSPLPDTELMPAVPAQAEPAPAPRTPAMPLYMQVLEYTLRAAPEQMRQDLAEAVLLSYSAFPTEGLQSTATANRVQDMLQVVRIARSFGFQPQQVAQEIYMMGTPRRPCLSTKLKRAVVLHHGGRIDEVIIDIDLPPEQRVQIDATPAAITPGITAFCTVTRNGHQTRASFSVRDAIALGKMKSTPQGIIPGPGSWQSSWMTMLATRACSRACDRAYADLLAGLASQEAAQDMADLPTAELD